MVSPTRIRVLHVTERLTGRGGADVHLLSVLHRQVGRVEPGLAVGQHHPDQAIVPAGIPVHALRGLAARALGQPIPRGTLDRLDRIVAETRPHVIHMQNVVHPDLLGWAAGTGPSVATVQDHRPFCPGAGKVTPAGDLCARPASVEVCATCFPDRDAYFAGILERTRQRLEGLRRIGAVVVLSRYMAGELALAGLRPGRIHVIPPFSWFPGDRSGRAPGVRLAAPSRFRSPAVARGGAGSAPLPVAPSGRPVVLMAGRLSPSKGGRDLVLAVARVRDIPGAGTPRLVVIGEGPDRDALARLARERSVDLDLHPWADRCELAVAITRASVLVVPSRWQEPFGIVALEAIRLGTPVVATRVGGLGEWLDGIPGTRCVTPGSPEELAAALAGILADPARGRDEAARGWRVLEARFDPTRAMDDLEALYRSVLEFPEDGRPGSVPADG